MPDPDLAPIDHLRTLGQAAELGTPLPPATAAWCLGWTRIYEARCKARDPISIERAAGLGAPGRPNWVRTEELAQRDAQLRALHRDRFADLEPNAAARAIRAMSPRPVADLPNHRQLVNILRRQK